MSTMNGMSSMASFNDIKYPPNVAISGRTSADLETDRWGQGASLHTEGTEDILGGGGWQDPKA